MQATSHNEGRTDSKLGREELFKLYDQQTLEIRACLYFAHRNLAFYVGLLSAILVAMLASLLSVEIGDKRALALLFGPLIIVLLAEVGYSMVTVFYHRFVDATLTVLNIHHMLRLDDPSRVPDGVGVPVVPSHYGDDRSIDSQSTMGAQRRPRARPTLSCWRRLKGLRLARCAVVPGRWQACRRVPCSCWTEGGSTDRNAPRASQGAGSPLCLPSGVTPPRQQPNP